MKKSELGRGEALEERIRRNKDNHNTLIEGHWGWGRRNESTHKS